MAWKGIVGQKFTVEEFRKYVDTLKWNIWRPSFMCLHNTAAPTLAQWKAYPAEQRIKNLENYYKNEKKWNAGPHAFIADDYIWLFTPLTTPGVHSPSFNGSSIGVELVGDYSREDPSSGPGFKAKMNAVAFFAILHGQLGIDPGTIRFHKEDPRTTHDCPGNKLNKQEFIQLVREYMGEGGEHNGDINITINVPEGSTTTTDSVESEQREGTVVVPVNDTLNVREGSSASSNVVVMLPPGTKVAVLGEVMNGNTKWYRVWVRVNGLPYAGWASAAYIKID